jgi:hypothetical protein
MKKKEKKKRFNCDSFVMMRRFKNEMRFFIFENLRRMFFVFRLNTVKNDSQIDLIIYLTSTDD